MNIASALNISDDIRDQGGLREGEERFRALVMLSPDALYLHIDGQITLVNPAMCQLLGADRPEQLLGRSVFDIVHPEYHQLVRDRWKALADGKPAPLVEQKFVKLDGSAVDVEVSAAQLDFHGHVEIQVIARDITRRKRIEEELLWKTAFLEAQVHSALDGLLVMDSQGKKVLQNQRLIDLWKIPRAISESGDEERQFQFVLSQTTDPAHYAEKVAYLYSHPDEVSRDEIQLIDGTTLDRYSAPVKDKSGKYFGRICTFRDVTQQKKMEAALKTSEGQLRATFDGAAIGIALVNMQGQPVKCNPALCKILGYTAEELCGMNFAQFTHPEDVDADMKQYRSLIAGEREQYEMTKRYVRKDGRVVWGRLTVSLVKQAEGGTPLAIGMIEDITESRKLEEQMRQAQKMEAIGQLAGGVAHDFNNTLSVIQMQAGLLGASEEIPLKEREFAYEIMQAAEHAANLTRQLLVFSRRQAVQAQTHDLNKLLANIAKMLQRVLGEDIQIRFKWAKEQLFINADASMMDQILMNLAVNARDAMPKGGELTVETAVVNFDERTAAQTIQARPGSFVCLVVSDNGCGISQENLGHIFEPFFTTKEVGRGTGLGLATVFGIVQQHQGWINVESQVGQGTTFRIYLPHLENPSAPKAVQSSRTSMPRGSETILFVEDDPSVGVSIQTILNHLGYRVFKASSGIEALEIWKRHREEIRLLLTDLVMPQGMSGRELAAALLKDKPDLKVIYSSGYHADSSNVDLPLKEGVNFLSKPFSGQTLSETIRKNLDPG